MTAPRQVLPGRFYLLTRRTTDRQFFLRPDEKLNNTFLYCLALVSMRHGISVLGFVVLSDHYHAVVYDPHGTINEFNTDFHALVARSVNALRERTGYFWDGRAPSVVDLLDIDSVLDKLIYVMANPVKHDLVEHAETWPGLSTFAAMKGNKPLVATRPDHFFSAKSSLPKRVTLTVEIPSILGKREAIVKYIADAVRSVEASRAEHRRSTRSDVVGRRRILGSSWAERATTPAPTRGFRPRFASRSKRLRMQAVESHQTFVREYRHARELWLAGLEAVFPAGTYWLQRFMDVPTEPVSA